MTFKVYSILTRKCDKSCKHCYLSAGPDIDETMSLDDFARAISHLPKSNGSLKLSGGELFTIDVGPYLDIIKTENEQREKRNKIHISVQTNGSFGKSKRRDAILETLAAAGVKDMDISSDDAFHAEQGIESAALQELQQAASNHHIITAVRGGPQKNSQVMPIGRGKNISNELDLEKSFDRHCVDVLDNYSLGLLVDGRVVMCCYSFGSLGNLFEEPLTRLVRQGRKNQRYSIMNAGGPEALAVNDGWQKKDVKDLLAVHGTCGLCYRLFKDEFALE